jgi:ATP-dependent Lhr-like helicase
MTQKSPQQQSPPDDALHDFHPVVRTWFKNVFSEPTPPQTLGWPSIAGGRNTLILAPTGSGKTLAAFLWAINHVFEQHLSESVQQPGTRILYVSPLKALNNDIHRNLQAPLKGIEEEAQRRGLDVPLIRTAVRTGDTPQSKRAAIARRPPDILITTPESLYLMLTSRKTRWIFSTVQHLIIDEIHSVCGNKRGVHLSLSLERLARLTDQEPIRIGLSATQKPLDRIAAFLGGQDWIKGNLSARPVTIIDAGRKKEMDLRVETPVADFSLVSQEGVWPLIFSDLLEQIRRHTTTLVFVNNRRLAERIAAKLNEMLEHPDSPSAIGLFAVPRGGSPAFGDAPREGGVDGGPRFLVQAYHGSMSQNERARMEEDLKAGRLRALVTTSALELGIDIGSIDLVVQLQSPKGVARGLQRVGRSGHLVSATSKGRIYPTHREDLVEGTVVAGAMMTHEVEETTIPENCLDVLAQQIVAMVAVEEWDGDELFDVLRQSFPYRRLSHKLFTGVLQMLAGRYAREDFPQLRPRISWDKLNNRLRPLPGSSRLAVTGGGTITDRGYFGVYLEDGKTKVGEVDEEFVYETRVGDTFILGTSVWRVAAMDANRVTVNAAPGQPARMPFWRGEGIGRSVELGNAVGAFRRELASRLNRPDCLSWLQREYPIDSRSAWNILEYFRKQREVAGVVPHDRLILVEGFRDEIGDPRIVIHSAFGRRVNGLLGLVLARLLHEETGVEPQMYADDNGVLLRCPDADALPLDLLGRLSPETAGEMVMEELTSSPLFAGQFRQNAVRSLLMPRLSPGKRTPLWLQRLRAGDLLQVSRRYDDFPIVVETVRETLHDILDYGTFISLLRAMQTGHIGIHTTFSEVPSPFAASLLFSFIAVYMYEWDQPKTDRLSQYLSINKEILSEVVDLDTLPDLIRPEAILKVEHHLQHQADGARARSPEELMEILLRIGDLTDDEIAARCEGDSRAMIRTLADDGRAERIQFPDGPRWIAGEDRDLYREYRTSDHLPGILGRYIQHHGPITPDELAHRYSVGRDEIERATEILRSDTSFVRGQFRPRELPGADQPQWVYKPNIARIHRQTLSILRREIQPCSFSEFTRFLHYWQNLGEARRLQGIDGLRTCLDQLQGLPLPSDLWARDLIPGRVHGVDLTHLDQITSGGNIVWAGTGPGRMMAFPRGAGRVFLQDVEEAEQSKLGEAARRILEHLEGHGASFLGDIRDGVRLSLQALNRGISELFWKGYITNDLFTEITQVRKPARARAEVPLEPIQILSPQRNPYRSRLVQTVRKTIRQTPGWKGRWSLLRSPAVLGQEIPLEERASAQASQALHRYGILARELYRREAVFPWSVIAAELQRMEMRGEIRRGFFVDGLSGMQYALPSAIETLRRLRSQPNEGDKGERIILNACDPANPFGPGIDLPVQETKRANLRFQRQSSHYLVFQGGEPLVYIEQYGSRIWTFEGEGAGGIGDAIAWLTNLLGQPSPLRPVRTIRIEHIDGDRAARSPLAGLFLEAGFRRDRDQTLTYDGY